jgi:hypothetical protein
LLAMGTAVSMWLRWSRWFSLADSVDDAGSALVVRRGRAMQEIGLAGIRAVVFHAYPPCIALQLERAGPFGDEVRFIPHNAVWNPFASEHPLELALKLRVHEARNAPLAT